MPVRFTLLTLLLCATGLSAESIGEAARRARERRRQPAATEIEPQRNGKSLAEWIAMAERSADRSDRIWAIDTIGWMGPAARRAVPLLLGFMKEEHADIRGKAAEALGGIGSPEAVPALKAALDDPHEINRMSAGYAWWRIQSDPVALQSISKGLTSASWQVRSMAANMLGMIGPRAKDAVPALIAALAAPQPSFEGQQVPLLDLDVAPIERRDLKVVDGASLDKRTTMPETLVRRMVLESIVEALGNIGPAAVEAVAALEGLAEKDADATVRTKAAAALKKIRSAP